MLAVVYAGAAVVTSRSATAVATTVVVSTGAILAVSLMTGNLAVAASNIIGAEIFRAKTETNTVPATVELLTLVWYSKRELHKK